MSSEQITQALDLPSVDAPALSKYPASYPACLDVGDLGPKPIVRPDGAVEIALTQGYTTVIDAADADMVTLRRWCATVTAAGYVYAMRRQRGLDSVRRPVMLHRVILEAPDGYDVDHINGDTLDNRRGNLRLATRQQNTANGRRRKEGASSQYRGVFLDHRGRKWRAQIREDGRQRSLGAFDTEEAAARAYNEEAVRIYGPFARLNPIPEPRA